MNKRIGWIGLGRMGEAFNAFIKTEVEAAERIAKAANLKGQ